MSRKLIEELVHSITVTPTNNLYVKNIQDNNINISKLDSKSDFNQTHDNNVDNPDTNKKNKLRCFTCNVKLNITNNTVCKCEKILCAKHKYFNEHECNFDFKEFDKKILEKNNPKIVSDKILKI